MPPPRKKDPTPPDFEQSMAELESLIAAMESGQLSLEQSMAHFERGIQLTRSCQRSLCETEQRVKVLLEEAGQEKLVDFDAED